jgi:hypothetical protein
MKIVSLRNRGHADILLATWCGHICPQREWRERPQAQMLRELALDIIIAVLTRICLLYIVLTIFPFVYVVVGWIRCSLLPIL